VRGALLPAVACVGVIATAGPGIAVTTSTTGAVQASRASLFVAPDGSDGRSCESKKAPCASFERAYRVAKPGQVVEVAEGTYPGQNINAVVGRTGPNVVFRPAVRARVVVGGLTLGVGGELDRGPDHLTFRDMHMSYKRSAPGARNQEGISIGAGSSHIRLERMDAGSLHMWFANRVTVLGGDYGPCDAVAGSSNVCGNNMIDVSSNVTVNGALFHDYRFDGTCFSIDGADCHWECMYINGGENITVRNSKFRDCTLYNIFATISGPDAARIGHRNLLVENNWFDTPWTEDRAGGQRARPSGISLAWCQNSPHGYRGVHIRFNSFQRNTGIELDRNMSCRWENVRIVGNLLMYPGACDSRITYAYNLWTTAWRTGRCASSDRIVGNALPYANAASGRGFNFRLRPKRTVADDLVPASVPGGCPRLDIDRKRRSGKRCDAGSDERSLR
jgi:hypothetical protein